MSKRKITTSSIIEPSFKMEISMGRINGVSQYDKFGRNPGIASGSPAQDVWNGGGLYTGFPSIAEELEVFSSDINDTGAGTGARTVEISNLLDENYNEMPAITVTLNGTTPVSLGTQTYLRCTRMKVISAGSNGANLGTITIRHKTTIVNIFGVMPIDHNQTSIMAFTVPLGKTIIIDRGNIMMARANGGNGSANANIRVRKFGEVFQAKRDVEITNSQSYTFENNGFMVFEEKTDIKVTITDVSDNGTIVSSEADGYIIDNSIY